MLERRLEMERLTARACAAEAVEIELQSEERLSQVLEELSCAESENRRLREPRGASAWRVCGCSGFSHRAHCWKRSTARR